MSQTHHQATPSFLLKLRDIMASQLYPHIIRWDRSGQSICIVCIQALQEIVLPQYFRHTKFSSFVRQLNMYGFHKKKADKNISASFCNQFFTKTNIVFSAMAKKYKKPSSSLLSKDTCNDGIKTLEQNSNQHQFSTQLGQNSVKISSQAKNQTIKNKQIQQSSKNQYQNSGPQINELIAELTQKTQVLMGYGEENWIKSLEIQLLLSQPKFKRINYAIVDILNLEELSPFAKLTICTSSSDRMEFIL